MNFPPQVQSNGKFHFEDLENKFCSRLHTEGFSQNREGFDFIRPVSTLRCHKSSFNSLDAA